MRRQFLFTICVTLALAVLVPVSVTGHPSQAFGSLPAGPAEEVDAREPGPLPDTYGKLPLAFEANFGQAPRQVEFLARGSGYNLFLTPGEAVLALRKLASPIKQAQMEMALESPFAETGDAPAIEQAVLSMQLVGANAAPKMAGLERLPGKVNYLLGHDPAKWRSNVSTYAKVEYQAVYPGVDLIYYGSQGQLEYDFIIAPGADPDVITLGFAGAEKLEVDARGDLIIRIAGEQVRMRQPVLYQEGDGVREPVAGGFRLWKTAGRTEIGFRVGAYDASRPLVIDPVLVYSTFLGGSGQDIPNAIAVDTAGSAYITGYTTSLDFPVANALQPVCVCGDQDLFVTKFSPGGEALVYSTYLGGSWRDNGFDIAVDAAGNAYVSGWTQSADFPTVNPAQPAFGGGVDTVVFKLNPGGSALLYSTFLGGSGTTEYGNAIAVDAAGSAYVAGVTDSPNFPTVTPLQAALSGAQDGYLARLDPAGSTLLYSTYFGGSGLESASGVALDAAGDVLFAGNTNSPDLSVMAALQPAWAGGLDGFVLKLNTASSTLHYSTYLGGAGDDVPVAVAVDAAGAAHVAGYTGSPDFPIANALQPSLGGGRDIFAARLSPAGSGLVYSTYLGGGSDDLALEMALDSAGSLYLSGWTQSADFPIVNAVQPVFGGGTHDSLALKLSADGSALGFSTYLGGSAEDRGTGIAVDTAGAVYLTGLTLSTDFPTMNPLQPTHAGGFRDAFVAKLADSQPPAADAGGPYEVDEGAAVSVTASGSDPEAGALTYAWDLDNNGTFETAGQSVTFSALDGPGNHTITVQVTDSGGLTATASTTVDVLNVAPTAGFTGTPGTLLVGQSATVAFSNPSDPAAADTAAGFHYSYDCTNDGTFELANAADASYTCAYSIAGTFNARGRIADKDGGFSDYTVPFTVLTPRQGTEDLIDQVQDLIPGTLSNGQGNALLAKLDEIIKQLEKGKISTAINELEAFINQVNNYMSSTPPLLSPAEGQPLIDAANAIITALGG